MKPLLYLVHRIPYPPNKGDKIRSFHWLKGLAENFDVYLGTFVDDENDWQYVEQLNKYCVDVHIEKLEPNKAKLKSLKGLFTGEPLTLPYYSNRNMQQWVENVIHKNKISDVLVFSSSMAQFVNNDRYQECCRIIDFVDMDSDKWMQYAEKKQWPMSWIYQREAKTLLDYEKRVAEKFNKSLFVSSKESDLFSSKVNNPKVCIDYVNNGVDTEYFDNELELPSPYSGDDKVIVFTGAMDYWANVDAVKWFSENIFSTLKQLFPKLQFYIVGSKPAPEVLNLKSVDGVQVTGFVDDVRPYVSHADIVVAPMRIARGIQNKVLEAMSLAKSVVVSPQGFEGLNAQPGKELLLANTRDEWINVLANALNNPSENFGHNARECVVNHYSWRSNTLKLSACFDEK